MAAVYYNRLTSIASVAGEPADITWKHIGGRNRVDAECNIMAETDGRNRVDLLLYNI